MKKLFCALLALCLLFVLTGCFRSEGVEETPVSKEESSVAEEVSSVGKKSTISVGVLLYQFDDRYISSVRTAIEKYAGENEANITLDFQDGQNDQATQSEQLDILLQKDPDVILINPVDVYGDAAQDLANKVRAAGVPTIFFNREPEASLMQSANALFVGVNPSKTAVVQGDILADLYEVDKSIDKNGDGKLQYVVVKGEPGGPEAEARTKYCVDQAVARGLDMDPVQAGPVVGNWDTAMASDAMTALLGAKKDTIEVVFCNNDDMALGVIAALQSVGMNKGGKEAGDWIPVLGIDATDAGMEAVNNGSMYGTVKQDADAMGKALVDVAINAANDDPFPFLSGTSYALNEDGVSIRIPYAKVVSSQN